MCLAVPGRIVEAPQGNAKGHPGAVATVDFQGTRAEVSLVLTPEARVGEWVLVHAGFALQVLDETEAMTTWRYLQRVDRVDQTEGIAKPPSLPPNAAH